MAELISFFLFNSSSANSMTNYLLLSTSIYESRYDSCSLQLADLWWSAWVETSSLKSSLTMALTNNLTYESLLWLKYSSFILSKSYWPPASAINKASAVLPAFKATSAAYSKFPISKFLLMIPSAPSSQFTFLEIVSVMNYCPLSLFVSGLSKSLFFYSSILLLLLAWLLYLACEPAPSSSKNLAAFSAVIGVNSFITVWCCYYWIWVYCWSWLGLFNLFPKYFSTS